MPELDLRLLRVSIEVNGQLRQYTDLAMTVQGQKFANPNQGEVTVSITNLAKEVRDNILTETSPFNRNRTPKRILIEAGRVSTGYSLLYTGNIYRANITQKPDQQTVIRALTGQFQQGNIVSMSLGEMSSLSTIANQVGQNLGLSVVFEAQDKQIANFTYNGPAAKQVDKLAELGNVSAFIDNETLFVKEVERSLSGRVRVIRPNDIIGIPEVTEQGLKLSFLYDTQTQLGGMLDVTSLQYPEATGQYVIYKLAYSLANRDTPFYYTAEARRL